MDLFGENQQSQFLNEVDFIKVFSSFNKPVAIKDIKNDIVYMNDLARKLEVSSEKEIFPSFTEEESNEIRKINASDIISVEKVIKGHFFHIETITLFNQFGLFYGTIFIFYDMTNCSKNILEPLNNENLKIYDDLTGFFMQTQFEEIAAREVDRAKRYGTIFSVVYFVFDDLVLFGQSYGGDKIEQLLKYYGLFFRKKFRKTDFIFRFDFNEFCIILPYTSNDVAADKFKKIKKDLYDTIKDQVTGQPILFYGISQFDLAKHFKNWSLLIDEAKLSLKKVNRSIF